MLRDWQAHNLSPRHLPYSPQARSSLDKPTVYLDAPQDAAGTDRKTRDTHHLLVVYEDTPTDQLAWWAF
jgi:hypothetical protein